MLAARFDDDVLAITAADSESLCGPRPDRSCACACACVFVAVGRALKLVHIHNSKPSDSSHIDTSINIRATTTDGKVVSDLWASSDFPSALAWDSASRSLFVFSNHSHRIIVVRPPARVTIDAAATDHDVNTESGHEALMKTMAALAQPWTAASWTPLPPRPLLLDWPNGAHVDAKRRLIWLTDATSEGRAERGFAGALRCVPLPAASDRECRR